MSTNPKPRGVHFVGSAPYATAEDTFTHIAKALPGRVRRIPDGEPGKRNYWTWWLHGIFPDWALSPLSYPAKLAASRGEPDPGPEHWMANMVTPPERKPGDKMIVKPSNYAEEAIASYEVFKRLKTAGVIEPGVRFQVSFATSCAITISHIAYQYRTEADAALEPHILDAVRQIQQVIPAEELAIQFDLAAEMGLLEKEQGRSPDLWFAWFEKGTTMSELVPRVARYAEAVKEPVELGFHFCYGDIGHQHWAEPLDTGLIVSLFNEITKVVKRPIEFIQLPVPVNRDDDDYFKPLTAANIDPKTELYLGVVREKDPDGTDRRLAAAQRVLERPFGVATECGMGRIDIASADDVLKISSVVADPVN